MNKLIFILLIFFFSINVHAIDMGVFYSDKFAGISATSDRVFFGVGYRSLNDSTFLELGRYTVDAWSFLLLFRNKPVEELKLNFVGGLRYVTSILKGKGRSVPSNQSSIYLGVETKISILELKILYVPLRLTNIHFDSGISKKQSVLVGEGLKILVNIPFNI
tara:strand:- start:3621 stop:4106 length:486 start_codon:yes stop_codon:yes gene_type:complete